MWQYYLSSPLDGKPKGWHNYSSDVSDKLTTFCNQSKVTAPGRAVFHVRSGVFHYEVDTFRMEQRNVTTGTLRTIRNTASDPDDGAVQPPSKKLKRSNSLQLNPVFSGLHGSLWRKLLEPFFKLLSDAPKFLGPNRDPTIVPVRELTFQALKPNHPADWRVVVFGTNPYPRVQSATGIALFDNDFKTWESPKFGVASSMRCLIKAAAMSEHGVSKDTKVSQLRAHLKEKNIVSPPEWFRSMLSQGTLLMNTALTTGGLTLSKTDHSSFWNPVVSKIIEHILIEKASLSDEDDRRSITFLWWGADATRSKRSFQWVFSKFSDIVPINHLHWFNPAAQGDKFCGGDVPHLTAVNDVLHKSGQKKINWLPSKTWLCNNFPDATSTMSNFISDTQKLHSLYLDRLQSGLDEEFDKMSNLATIQGIMKLEIESIENACVPICLQEEAKESLSAVSTNHHSTILNTEEMASIYMYTGCTIYNDLNSALRNEDRSEVEPFFPYLRVFLQALDKVEKIKKNTVLYRGISKNLSHLYKQGSHVTWWNVVSCSADETIAKGFCSSSDDFTLFRVESFSAAPIQEFSAIPDEDELIISPGTTFEIVKVSGKTSRKPVITLRELLMPRKVY